MSRTTAGKSLLTLLMGIFVPLNVLFDWNQTHVFNPAWPPHARFHAAFLSVFIWSVLGIAIWLLWRRTAEPEVGVRVAALVVLAIWTPFFYLSLLVPGTSIAGGDPPGTVPIKIGETVIEPQLIAAVFFLLLTAWGYRLAIRPPASRTN